MSAHQIPYSPYMSSIPDENHLTDLPLTTVVHKILRSEDLND